MCAADGERDTTTSTLLPSMLAIQPASQPNHLRDAQLAVLDGQAMDL